MARAEDIGKSTWPNGKSHVVAYVTGSQGASRLLLHFSSGLLHSKGPNQRAEFFIVTESRR